MIKEKNRTIYITMFLTIIFLTFLHLLLPLFLRHLKHHLLIQALFLLFLQVFHPYLLTITTIFVPCPFTSSASIPIQPQNSESTNPTSSASESVYT